MSHELICAWLGLPANGWPPDHYRLLGLEPGEADVGLIEQRVHQRLDAVRRYQMMHPEPATEAMNRLAQAFVCLTEPAAKRAYDAGLLGAPAAPAPPALAVAPPPLPPRAAAPVPPPLPTPPPLPPPLPANWTAPAASASVETLPEPEPEPEPALPEPEPEPVDPVLEAAQGERARRGLATKRALYRRVQQTRGLLRLWREVGRYLTDPQRKITRQDAQELRRVLDEVEEALQSFPPVLGEAGQPGYMVIALTQLDGPRPIQALSLNQRESLGRDWQAGLRLLRAHTDVLRWEVRAMRLRPLRVRAVRAARAFVNEQPATTLLVLLALLALTVAVWRTATP